MTPTIQALNVLLPVLYLVAAALYALALGGTEMPQLQRHRRLALLVALAAHLALFVALRASPDGFPTISTWTMLSAVAFTTAVLYAIWARLTGQAATGGAVLGVVFGIQLLASAFARPPAGALEGDLVTALHIATSLLASSAIILSGIHGALYMLLYRQMRRRTFGLLFKFLPDLQELAKLTRGAALAGFILLGLGLNVGIGLAHAGGETGFTYTDPYVLIIMGLWIHLGIVAFSSKIRGLNAWRASFAASAGFVFIMLALLMTLTPATFHVQN